MKITGKELRGVIRETLMQEMPQRPVRGMARVPGGRAYDNPSSVRGDAYGDIRPQPGLDDDDAVEDILDQASRLYGGHGVQGVNIYRDVDGTLYGRYVKRGHEHKVNPRWSDN